MIICKKRCFLFVFFSFLQQFYSWLREHPLLEVPLIHETSVLNIDKIRGERERNEFSKEKCVKKMETLG
ncbi:hypothetical protein Hanom_Chr02g00125811 [Helianthus anomalus]